MGIDFKGLFETRNQLTHYLSAIISALHHIRSISGYCRGWLLIGLLTSNVKLNTISLRKKTKSAISALLFFYRLFSYLPNRLP